MLKTLKVRPTTKITRLAMRNRFLASEKRSIYTAADTNVDIRIFLDDLNAATFIDISREDTITNVHMLEEAGLLDVGRASIILDTPVDPQEVHK